VKPVAALDGGLPDHDNYPGQRADVLVFTRCFGIVTVQIDDMNRIHTHSSRIFAAILIAFAVLQACSSGGSGGSASPPGGGTNPPPSSPSWMLPITLFDRHGRIAAGSGLYAVGQNGASGNAFSTSRSFNQGASWESSISTVSGVTDQMLYRGFAAVGDTLHFISRDPVDNHLYYSRSNDSGETWLPRVQVSTDAADAISFRRYSLGVSNDVLHLFDSSPPGLDGLRYYRSVDGGQTWTRSLVKPGLAFGVTSWELPTLAVIGDTIHLAWSGEDGTPDLQVYYARSDDAGLSFAFISRLSDGSKLSTRQDLVVIGSDVIVGWGEREYDISDADDFVVRRSLDAGVTWLPQQTVAAAPAGRRYGVHVIMTGGQGDRVHATYQDDDINSPKQSLRAVYQLSADRGATWSGIEEISTDSRDGVSQVTSMAVTPGYIHVLLGDPGVGAGPQPTRYSRRPLN
jgi:hypothetical protein